MKTLKISCGNELTQYNCLPATYNYRHSAIEVNFDTYQNYSNTNYYGYEAKEYLKIEPDLIKK